MKTILVEEELPHAAATVWAIVGDVTRSDWVPGVDAISEVDDVRSFTMAEVGEVQERILINVADDFCLQYAAIKTPAKLEHHLATIQLTPAGEGCLITWTTEIAPPEFADSVEQRMKAAIKQLQQVLGGESA